MKATIKQKVLPQSPYPPTPVLNPIRIPIPADCTVVRITNENKSKYASKTACRSIQHFPGAVAPNGMTQREVERLIEMYRAGMTYPEISKHLGRSKSTLHARIKRLIENGQLERRAK